MLLDALPSSHPIRVPCPDEAAILSVFDAISYSKVYFQHFIVFLLPTL